MSKTFVNIIKGLSFVVAIGYSFFIVLPILSSMIFTIGMGGSGNIFNVYHIVMYTALLVEVLFVYVLVKIVKNQDGKKVLRLFIGIILLIVIYQTSLIALSDYREDRFNVRKAKDIEESRIFLRDHCTKISATSTLYKCDDGSIRR